ncbi:MAG: helix-turn-helix domain-containing protein [Deltaproteobacteria bacterium]
MLRPTEGSGCHLGPLASRRRVTANGSAPGPRSASSRPIPPETRGRLPLLTLTEAAHAARTSPSTIPYWIAIGRLPGVKPGRRRLICRTDLARLLELEPHEVGW